jgi:hypothetical protein
MNDEKIRLTNQQYHFFWGIKGITVYSASQLLDVI